MVLNSRTPTGFWYTAKLLFLLSLLVCFTCLPAASAIDLTDLSVAEQNEGKGFSFKLIDGGIPAFSFLNSSEGRVYYYQRTNQGWARELVASGLGLDSETYLEQVDNQIYLFVYNGQNRRLELFKRDHSGWSSEILESSNVSPGFAGTKCGPFVCVVFKLQSSQSLKYYRGSFGSWTERDIPYSGSKGDELAIAALSAQETVFSWYDVSGKRPAVSTFSSSNGWAVQYLDTLDYNYGFNPALGTDENGRIHLAMSIYQNDSEGGLVRNYYAVRDTSRQWSTGALSNYFTGGDSSVTVDNSGKVYVSAQNKFINSAGSNKHQVQLSTLGTSGSFEHFFFDAVGGSGNSSVDYYQTATALNHWGEIVLAYGSSAGVRYHSELDSDGDLIPDSRESSYGTSASNPDSDNDGIIDGFEVFRFASNPNNSDSDGDGIQDGADNCPGATNSNQNDSDNDGLGDSCDSSPGNSSNGFPNLTADNGSVGGGSTTTTTVTTTSTTTTTLPAGVVSQADCSDWQSNNPSWLWCDDFEDQSQMSSNYYEYDQGNGTFAVSSEDSFAGGNSLRAGFVQGQASAGHLMRNFGRNPIGTQSHQNEDFQEVYWRYYVKMEDGFQGVPDKFSRGIVFAGPSWQQASIGHVWRSATEDHLVIDPVSGVDSSNNLVTTRWNDFDNFDWLGNRAGTTSLEAGKWYCLEAQMKLNTSGQADGALRVWLDGALEVEGVDLNWQGTWDEYGINSVFVSNYFNGGSPTDQARFMDSFVISTERIGCADTAAVGGSAGGTTSTTTTTSTTSTSTSTSTSSSTTTTTNSSTTTTTTTSTTTTTLRAGGVLEGCNNWQTNHPDWIWCDDFESSEELSDRYFDVGNEDALSTSSSEKVAGSRSLKSSWQTGSNAAGHLMKNIGENPVGNELLTGEKLKEVYWRFYVKHQDGFQGIADRLSRGTVFGGSSWQQAAQGQLLQRPGGFGIDALRGVDDNSNLATTRWNDFDNLRWIASDNAQHVFQEGEWHCVEMRMKLNDPGSSNGVLQYWLDERLQASVANLDWVGSWNDYGVNSVVLSNYFTDGSPVAQSRYFDSFVISKNRVGCGAPSGFFASPETGDGSGSSSSSSSSSGGGVSNPPPTTDGGVFNPPPATTDSDNDGLTDDQEISLGTDPNRADSDGDGVNDGDELAAGSNPTDSGSGFQAIGDKVCGEWNGFLGGLWNVLELSNNSEETRFVRTQLFSIDGELMSEESCTIASGAQCDILVHDMPGRIVDSYGRVCIEHNGVAGEVDGRMTYYKNDAGQFEFAFSMPFSNGKRGNQYVTFNTFNVGSSANNLVANWIQVTNLNDSWQRGMLNFYNNDGELIAVEELMLAPNAREDVSAHRFGVSNTGLVEWVPDSSAYFLIRNARYVYDNAQGLNSFEAASQVEGLKGIGEEIVVPVETESSISVVEIVNVLGRPVSAAVRVHGSSGSQLRSMTVNLPARSSYHLIVNEVLGENTKGLVFVDGNRPESIVAVGINYKKSASGKLKHVFAIPGREAYQGHIRGSYNTFLGQQSEVVLLNASDVEGDVVLEARRSDGSFIDLGSNGNLLVPARGMVVVPINRYEDEDNYGVVTVRTVNQAKLTGWVLRRNDDFTITVPLR